jgi:hypothetical protein
MNLMLIRFDENVDTEQHVEEDDETARSESDEELTGVTPYDVPASSRIDWGFILHR